MHYIRITDPRDVDIPVLANIYRLPEVKQYISIDEDNYWNYVASTKNVFYYKVLFQNRLAAAVHCELMEKTLFMDIVVFHEYRRQGLGSAILADLQSGVLPLDFSKIEVFIDEANVPSLRLFEKMGFLPTTK